jgi:hypothetical protein
MVTVFRNTKRSFIGAAFVLTLEIIVLIKAFRTFVTSDGSRNLAVIILGTVRETGVATVVNILPSLVIRAWSRPDEGNTFHTATPTCRARDAIPENATRSGSVAAPVALVLVRWSRVQTENAECTIGGGRKFFV